MAAFVKGVYFVCLFVVIPMMTSAQIFANASTPSHTEVSPLVVNARRTAYPISKLPGMRMMSTGKTLTIIGGALIAGGFIVYSNRNDPDAIVSSYSNGTYTYYNKYEVLGQLMVGVGTGMAVPGIIFWSKGSKKFNRYLKERQSELAVTGSGLALTYTF